MILCISCLLLCLFIYICSIALIVLKHHLPQSCVHVYNFLACFFCIFPRCSLRFIYFWSKQELTMATLFPMFLLSHILLLERE